MDIRAAWSKAVTVMRAHPYWTAGGAVGGLALLYLLSTHGGSISAALPADPTQIDTTDPLNTGLDTGISAGGDPGIVLPSPSGTPIVVGTPGPVSGVSGVPGVPGVSGVPAGVTPAPTYASSEAGISIMESPALALSEPAATSFRAPSHPSSYSEPAPSSARETSSGASERVAVTRAPSTTTDRATNKAKAAAASMFAGIGGGGLDWLDIPHPAFHNTLGHGSEWDWLEYH